jgi:hypothetical protein
MSAVLSTRARHRTGSGGSRTRSVVGVVCDGTRREVAAARSIGALARANGCSLWIIHPEPLRWAAVPGDSATTLDAGDLVRDRRDAVATLAADSTGRVRVDIRTTSQLGATLELAADPDVAVVVLLQPGPTARLTRRLVERRLRRDGCYVPELLIWRRDESSAAELVAAMRASVG